MVRLDADKFLEDLSGKHARNYTSLLSDMLVAMARGNRAQLDAVRKKLEAVISETMGTAEVLGASIVLREAAKVVGSGSVGLRNPNFLLLTFANTPTQTILPRVTFIEALEDMVSRTPATIRSAAERSAQAISRLYGEGRVVAFARSAEHAVTERVQSLIAEAIKEGIGEAEAGKGIKMAVDQIRQKTKAWTEGYSKMAFRTNVNTAVTAGRFRQAQDPDIKQVIPAFRFDAVMDSDTRHNHGAADGFIAKVDNHVWNRIAPPLGYNCRCQVSLVGLPELRRMGRVGSDGSIREDRLPAGAHPDAGFRHGGRPDLLIGGLAT
jgi:SPP1 gp7 family putative phage head morphogenesis protein